ncbi:MAG: M1 family metallopeptidase [Actinomycetota bacterium]|nr:M1 family metallopeptidase [Actinomycetota bacterium]
MSTTPTERHRLPTTVVPSRYELELEPDLATARFRGTEIVDLEIIESTSTIVCNAADLEIGECWLEAADGTRIDATVALDADDERATFTLADEVRPGGYRLHVAFVGELNDKLRGFYRSTFTDTAGEERVIATTQFESTNARRAFPCWDEPALKSTFAVTLVVDEDLFAVSCGGEIARESTGDGRVRVTFAETMRMSTYLVAFIVGPLEATEAVDVDGVPLRIVHPIGQGHLTPFALEAGAFALRYFTEYFGIPYPGDKLDMVAVPDFAFGAMENLGCVTFREVLLLVDPTTSTQPELQRVTDVIAHEIAHMWFGDLVTMKWWNGLWLKEAFATFMEMKATDAFRPAWKRWVDFGLSRTAAFDVDALESTRPVEYEVVSPADAEGMYDILTYEKGAALVRMLEQYLGEDRFRDGIRRYLTTHSHDVAETTDLWDAIEAETGEPTRQIMDTWIFQGGFPLVSASIGADGTTLTLQQQRFRYRAGEGDGDARWAVPTLVTVGRDGHDETERVLLDEASAVVTLADRPDFVHVNAGGHGFYRVGYDDLLRTRVLARAHDHLSPVERYGLVDDTVSAVIAGAAPASTIIDLVRAFGDEDDLSVWQRIASGLDYLESLLDDADLDSYRATVRDLVGPALDVVGWEPSDGEDDRRRELRATLFRTLGTTGADPAVRTRAEELLRRHLAEPGSVDAALAAALVPVVAANGDADDFATFTKQSNEAPTPQEQRRFLYALAEFDDDGLIDTVLDRCRTGEIRTQDSPFVIMRALGNRGQGERVWAFVKANWDELLERFPTNSISRMVGGVRSLNTPELVADTQAFFADHPVPQGAKTVEQHLEKQAVNSDVRGREGAALAEYLR